MSTDIAPLPIEIPAALIKNLSAAGYKHEQHVYRFANGYGASVVCGDFTYGGKAGLLELAVIRFAGDAPDDFSVTYATPITDDVIGWQSVEDVAALLVRIAALPGASDEH